MFHLGLIVFRKFHMRTTIGIVPMSYLVRSPRFDVLCHVLCHVSVMCCVAPFYDVPWCSDASIGVVGFVTRSRIQEEL
jgi:hypothetical protein